MKAFFIAGEASGDKLGAALIKGLRGFGPVDPMGVGGTRMQAEGVESLFPMDRLSVMGLSEILPRYRELKRRIADTAEAVIAARPDVLITIDSPDFCLRVAQRVKARAPIPTVHYVAPSVWAWRPGRAAKMARSIDHVLALLPFEPPYMTDAGMSCDFVGHPVVTDPPADPAEVAQIRAQLGGAPLCVLPGSRQSEVARLSPIFGAAIAGWEGPVLALAAPGRGDQLRQAVAQWPRRAVVIDSGQWRTQSVFAASEMALAASGTVSLELARAGTPMVIAYDVAWLSRVIMTWLARTDTVTLVNLVSDTRAVPEFIGARCQPDLIAQGLAAVKAAPDAQVQAMADTMHRLGADGPDPGQRAARSVMDFLARQGQG